MIGRVPDATSSLRPRRTTWLVALACQKPKELGLSSRAVDHSAARRACPSTRPCRQGARSPKSWGYPHELWTTRLLAAHARQHAPAGRASQPRETGPRDGLLDPGRAQGQAAQEPALAKAGVRYYLEKRDPEFDPKNG
jgi:hypothetical protein